MARLTSPNPSATPPTVVQVMGRLKELARNGIKFCVGLDLEPYGGWWGGGRWVVVVVVAKHRGGSCGCWMLWPSSVRRWTWSTLCR